MILYVQMMALLLKYLTIHQSNPATPLRPTATALRPITIHPTRPQQKQMRCLTGHLSLRARNTPCRAIFLNSLTTAGISARLKTQTKLLIKTPTPSLI